MEFFLGLGFILLVFGMGCVIGWAFRDSEVVDLQLRNKQLSSLAFDHKNRRTGYTSLWSGAPEGLNYDLQSYDDGKHWYATERDAAGGFRILGEVEEVYPGLMSTIEAAERLQNYNFNYGPIDVTGQKDGGVGLNLLSDVGFTVVRKESESN